MFVLKSSQRNKEITPFDPVFAIRAILKKSDEFLSLKNSNRFSGLIFFSNGSKVKIFRVSLAFFQLSYGAKVFLSNNLIISTAFLR